MNLVDIIVHEIKTESHSNDVSIVPREKALESSNPNVLRMMELINSAYSSATSLDYGKFTESLNFPKLLSLYKTEKKSFYDTTIDAMAELKSRMQTEPLSTGGYIVFARFSNADSTDFFMVVMLKIKEGLVFDENMDLLEVERLDLEQLHFAARINLTVQSSSPDKRYVSFLKGKRSSDNISLYFKAFLGVDEESYESAKGATNNFIDSLKLYATENEWTEEEFNNAKSRVFNYSKEQFDQKQAVTISALSNLIDPENSEKFIQHANQSELPSSFHIDRRVLNRLRRYSGGDKEVNISFSNETINRRIFIDQDNDTITLKGIPSKLKQDLIESQ